MHTLRHQLVLNLQSILLSPIWVITDIFPAETHALAGAVYQTVAQLSISMSIAIIAVISNAITDRSSHRGFEPVSGLAL